MEIDGIKVPTLAETITRFSGLLWGLSGAGKTTWAASLPTPILLINFDPDGPVSLGARDDIVLIDLSAERYTIVDTFKTDDDPLLPIGDKKFRLSKIIQDLGIKSVVVDSVSKFSELGTQKGISVTNGATVERPSPGAYGARNALTLRMMSGLLATTKRTDTHIMFITHEDDGGVKDKEGNILHITMLLGGKLGSQVGLQLSEVWHLTDNGKDRKVMVRPARMRKPMKTRMFEANDNVEFTLKYNPSKNITDHAISNFIKEWEENGRNKIQVPK